MATFVGKWSRSRESWKRMRPEVKRLRREATAAEALLWERLRDARLAALKFRRQHPVGHFIVDFCCPSARLIVEVDGPIHQGHEEEDAARQTFLEQRGYSLLRIRNEEVFTDVQAVLKHIRVAAGKA